MKFLFKYFLVLPTIFGAIIFTVGYFENPVFARDGSKPNLIHDAIGAKILTDNNIPFVKIISTRGGDVMFCGENRQLFVFLDKDKKAHLKQRNSSKCNKILTKDGVKDDNGAAPLFAKFFNSIKDENAENDSNNTPQQESKDKPENKDKKDNTQ